MASSRAASVTLPGEREILIVRMFDAARPSVWRAFTEPELVRRWWHAGRGEMTACEIDLRVGGRWRYAMVTPSGFDVGFHGVYREIVPQERIVSTEVYEGAPGGDENATLNTMTLTEQDGGTLMTILVEAPSREVRDAIVASGMEDGLQDALDLLERAAIAEAGDA